MTKEPIQNTTVELRGNDVHSSSSYAEADVILASTTTDEFGSFVLQSNQSKDHPRYFLKYSSSGSNDSHDTSFQCNSTKMDLGHMFSGSHIFKYKLRFLSTTTNCATIENAYGNIYLYQGNDTTFSVESRQISYNDIKNGDFTKTGFVLKTTDCQNLSTISITTYTFLYIAIDSKTIQTNY